MLPLLLRLLREIDSELSKKLRRSDCKRRKKPRRKRRSAFARKSSQQPKRPRRKLKKQRKRKLINSRLRVSGNLSSKWSRKLLQLPGESNYLNKELLPRRSMTNLKKLLTNLIKVRNIPWSRIRKKTRKTNQKKK